MKQFESVILYNAENGGAWVEVPFDAKAEFGSGRPKVKVLFDKKVKYRGSLVKMGDTYVLGVRKDIREKLGKVPGDTISVQINLDTEERQVEIPGELKNAFRQSPEAARLYRKMSYSHQREYAIYIAEAKKEETRQRRAEKAVEMILKKND